MAATGTPTTNLGLRRPQGTDPASVDDINYNSELIDTKMGPVGNTSLQAQVNALNSQLASDWGTKTTDWLASAEQDSSGAAAVFSKSGNIVTISIVTASHAHNENDQIATIETGYRPNATINTVGSVGTTPCIVRFGTDGRVTIWLLSGSVTGRLYVTATFATP